MRVALVPQLQQEVAMEAVAVTHHKLLEGRSAAELRPADELGVIGAWPG